MRFYCAFIICVAVSRSLVISQAPTVQDCPGAIPICKDYYDEPDPYAYSGEGNYFDEINFDEPALTCHTVESNGLWYSFTVQSSGILRFIIRPHRSIDDYDWIVFDMTYASCNDLRINPIAYMISSNTYGAEEFEEILIDSTGINTNYIEGDISNCNGPGPFEGPPFNPDVSVMQGRNYLLYVSNWSGSDYGYSIDFSASTAQIYDDNPPVIREVVEDAMCGESSFKVRFSENIQCNSLSDDMFTLSGPEGDITITNVGSNYCNAGAESDKEIHIETNTSFVAGDYMLNMVKPVYDACGNISALGGIRFNPGVDIVSVNTTEILCYGDEGSISIDAISESDTLLYSINGGGSYQVNHGLFDSLKPGEYVIAVNNKYDCMTKGGTVTLTESPDLVSTVENVVDIDRCEGDDAGGITVSVTGGTGNITYSVDGSNYVNDPVFSDLEPGGYIIYARDENNCEDTVSAEVGFIFKNCIDPPNVFTPNIDGKNDTWEIKNIELFPEAIIEIYDRWGNLLASYKGEDPGWDGRFNGNDMPADTYYYIVSIENSEPTRGQVTIIR